MTSTAFRAARSVRVLPVLCSAFAVGCTPVAFDVPPPPAVEAAIALPPAPEIRSEASDFEPELAREGVGSERLRLASQPVGLAPLADSGFVTDLHDHLLVALLAGDFRRVLDLDASQAVAATHSRRSGAESVELRGAMDDVLEVAPVSRARVVVTGEVVQHGQTDLLLPVRFWYEADELGVYEGRVDDYLVAREARLGELDSSESTYAQTFRQAKEAYEASLPWWQRVKDTVVAPEEVRAYDAFVDELDATRARMPEWVATADDLATRAAERAETNSVSIYEARLRLQVRDAAAGELLAVVQLSAQGRTADELVDNLAGLAASALKEQ